MAFFHLVQLSNLDISLVSFGQWVLQTSFPLSPDPLEDPSPLATEELETANGMSQNGTTTFGKFDSLLYGLSSWNMHRFSHFGSHFDFLLQGSFLCVDFHWILNKFSKPSFISCLLILSNVLVLCMFIFWYPVARFLVNLIHITSILSVFISTFIIFICNPLLPSSSKALAAQSSGADIWKVSQGIF